MADRARHWPWIGGDTLTTISRCGACSTKLRHQAKFCHQCGSPIAAAPDTSEYKHVTVLFADVVHSMDIAAALDLERLREVMCELLDRCAASVRRYGGTVESTGDGVMALFGAPIALEDHAFRGCLAALAIQEEAGRLAGEVERRDGVALRLRVGLNSGQVIAGEIGTAALGYTATGEQVGMAQRMESVAPPGGVMLSESTARLVEDLVVLAAQQWVQIKGAPKRVPAHLLLAVKPRRRSRHRVETPLIDRHSELCAVGQLLDQTTEGHGAIVGICGSPGIGKSRVAREAAALAAGRGIRVCWTFCESHAADIPFHVVTRWLRSHLGIDDLDNAAARTRVRAAVPEASGDDLLLLDDLLGIADPGVRLPAIAADARRRRLIALIGGSWSKGPDLCVIEDAQWLDDVSQSMLADLFQVVSHTRSMVLVTYRPEYRGALMRLPGARSINLAPLTDSESSTLVAELVGSHPSVGGLSATIADRAAGNPFFAEEMVRDLAQRGVLEGSGGDYFCRADTADVRVPDTVQATIESRIDRLTNPAKRTLNAASVIGTAFRADLLALLGVEGSFDELVEADLIDRVQSASSPHYAFRHPLIRAVAYESQLRHDRADLHRRLAAALESADPDAADQNAALIAGHLEAAGDGHAAYQWHMRAAAWSIHRDVAAARFGWERARILADGLPDDSSRPPLQIAPRALLCATAWRVHAKSSGGFDELRQLCSAVGDKTSLAIGMTGRATELLFAGHAREASRLVTEQTALLESIGDPTLTVGLAFVATHVKFDTGEFGDILRLAQRVVDLAEGDPAKGADFGVGSPLAEAIAYRGVARWWLGRPGWQTDLSEANVLALQGDSATRCGVVTWTYGFGVCYGVLHPDDDAVQAIEEALRNASQAGDDAAVTTAQYTLGIALLYRSSPAARARGLELIEQVRTRWLGRMQNQIPVADVHMARETARRGDLDEAIRVMRPAVAGFHHAGRLSYLVWGTDCLVEALLQRGNDGDVAAAENAIDCMVDLRSDEHLAVREITLLRLRALVCGARGDDVTYRKLVRQYAAMANSFGFVGHIAMAEAM